MIAQLVLFTGLRCSGTSSVAAALVGSGAGVLRRPRWPATAAALHLGPASCGKQPSATPWTPAGTVLGVRGYAKGGRGQLPDEGPPKAVTVALPFAITREQADAAFKAFHSRHWLQNPSLPRWRRAAKESYLPFWVGDASVQVEVLSAELGRDELVRQLNPRTRRHETTFQTVWRRVSLEGLGWTARHAPEEPDMQLYAAWKYARSDMEALRPGPLIRTARAITPDMLQAGAGAPSDTRHVGAFTVQPDVARRLLASRIESAERRRAEELVTATTGYRYVRFVQLRLTWLGPAGGDGPRLSPVYVPAYVYSWIHGGIKIQTFVSGVDGRASGPHHLDDTKVAVLATIATSGALLLSGAAASMTATQLFVSGVAVPFIASGLLARFWPAVRHLWQVVRGKASQAWHSRGTSGETDWSAEFVGAYSRPQEQRDRTPPGGGGGGPGGGPGGPDGGAESFAEFMRDFSRDPWAWLERELRRQQQQQQQRQQAGGAQGRQQQQFYEEGDAYYQQQRRQQQRQQQQWRQQQRSGGGGGGADPLGLYARLGVKPGASKEDISEAFRGLALKTHPDRYQGEAEKREATKRFQAITEAYQVLRDPSRRAQYDATGRA